jgi:hypothetical protein
MLSHDGSRSMPLHTLGFAGTFISSWNLIALGALSGLPGYGIIRETQNTSGFPEIPAVLGF